MNGPHELVGQPFDAVMSGPRAPVDSLWGYAFRTPLGDFCYSPNCARHVEVPPVRNEYPFRRKHGKFENFIAPRWWTDAFGYLSFIPLRPSFDGLALDCLDDVLSHVEVLADHKFALRKEKAEEWRRLEDLLMTASHLLKSRFSIKMIYPSLIPTPPSFLGFEETFSTLKIAQRRITAARDWFLVWIAYLSFLIANVQCGGITDHDWFSALALYELPQPWLSSIQSSMICRFSNQEPRVGVFLDIVTPTRRQPDVKWFFIHHVPVWYHWGTAQERLIEENDTLAYLRPPPELWQQVMTFITREPSGRYEYFLLKGDELSRETAVYPEERSSASRPFSALLGRESPPGALPEILNDGWDITDVVQDAGVESRDTSSASEQIECGGTLAPKEVHIYDEEIHREAHIATKPWESFFEARAIDNRRKLSCETFKQRDARQKREKKPPTTSAEVFVWDWDPDDPLKLIRTRVNAGVRENTLGSYGRSHCIYDPISNEWDVCEYFGSLDDQHQGSDDEDDVHPDRVESSYSQSGAILADEEADHQALISEHVREGIQSFYRTKALGIREKVSYVQVDLTVPSGTLDIIQYLSDHYGFVPPLPRPLVDPSPVSINDWNECMKSVGLRLGDHNFPVMGLSATIIAFIRGLQSSPHSIPVDNWDLLSGNRLWIKPSILDYTYRLGDLFVIRPCCLDPAFPTPWFVALRSAADVLLVIRILHRSRLKHSSASLARLLADKGIRFYTLQHVDARYFTIPINAVEIQIPRRLAGYIFRPSDYCEYVACVKSILRGPRSRAALLHGGIVGRLAREVLNIDTATLGPSSAALAYHLGYSIEDSSGNTFWDDALSERELQVICGMHHCFTGHGQEQMAKLSWWPLPEYWDHPSNGFNWGSWTEWNEVWYQARLAAILRGDSKDGVPLNHNAWRSKLKGAGVWKKVTNCVRTQSEKLFDST